MHALLLGAGFSRWAAGLPLASELFDFAVRPFGPREEARLHRVISAKRGWDAFGGGPAEAFISALVESGGTPARDVVWYIVRRLAEPYIWEESHVWRSRRHVLSIDERRVQPRPGIRETARFLARIRGLGLAGVISTNYDMLIEYALGSTGFHYGRPGERLSGRGPYPVSQWARPVRLAGPVGYAKLHGSISWREDGRFTDGRGAITGDALVVPPVPGKLIRDSLPDVWLLAESTLRQSSDLITFGFAFNPYDEEVLELLRSAGDQLQRVLLVDPMPPVERAANLWPFAQIDTIEPSDAVSVTDWIRAKK